MRRRDFIRHAGAAAVLVGAVAQVVRSAQPKPAIGKKDKRTPDPHTEKLRATEQSEKSRDLDNWNHIRLLQFHESVISTYTPKALYCCKTHTFSPNVKNEKEGGFRFVFIGDHCGKCKATVNIPHGPGWFCRCGHYNCLPFHGGAITHPEPNYGPTAKAIQTAARLVLRRNGVRR